jgi:exopolysaccharide biosynthesis protein
LTRDERKLLLFVVDGRQPNYSEGVTIAELTELICEYGGWTALHLDGGGSSTLVREGENGVPVVVNWPIHGRHPPGRERPVANHLGIFAHRR